MEKMFIGCPLALSLKMKREIIGEILEDRQEIILMQGGKGGLGNEHFKSATNQTPRYAQPGLPEEGYIVFELKVLADVGLVSFLMRVNPHYCLQYLPLNLKLPIMLLRLLTPNLGIVDYRNYKSFVMADIPGIIEGAAEGKGQMIFKTYRAKLNSSFLIPADAEDYFQELKYLKTSLKSTILSY